MARIPDHEIERLKKEISVERLAEARGIKLMRHGADLLGKCPFHNDRTPSLVITPGKNLWHCLGACHAGGTAIDWIMRAEGISFRHAVELLRADHLPLAASWTRSFLKTAALSHGPVALPLSSRPQRTRISCHVGLKTTACAAFGKESRMNFASAINSNRKSGVAERRDLRSRGHFMDSFSRKHSALQFLSDDTRTSHKGLSFRCLTEIDNCLFSGTTALPGPLDHVAVFNQLPCLSRKNNPPLLMLFQ